MARVKREPKRWPSWRFGPSGESAIFECEEDVPFGWVKKPGEAFVIIETPTYDREFLIEELTKLEIKVHPSWGTAHLKKVLDDASSTR